MITANFALQLDKATNTELVQDLLDKCEKISLENTIELARTLGMKLSVVAYDDDDSQNNHVPVDSEIFRLCWERCGKPTTFDEIKETR